MDTIKATVEDLIKKLEAKSAQEDPRGWVNKFFSKKELAHLKISYYKEGVLGLSVDSSAWLYHFRLKKETLTEKLRKRHKDKIKDIRFRLG